MKVFVDTSGWAAYFNERDANHKKAVMVWENLKKQRADLITSDYILDETITLLKVRGNANVAETGGRALLSSRLVRIVRISEDMFEAAFGLFNKYKNQQFSFTDCTSFEIMKRMEIQNAFTFDSDFVIMGFVVLEA